MSRLGFKPHIETYDMYLHLLTNALRGRQWPTEFDSVLTQIAGNKPKPLTADLEWTPKTYEFLIAAAGQTFQFSRMVALRDRLSKEKPGFLRRLRKGPSGTGDLYSKRRRPSLNYLAR